MKTERKLKKRVTGGQPKSYCLECEKVNACSCGNDDNTFYFYHKLRPPKTSNKVRFREFLRVCPQFVNGVPEHLHQKFRNLLKKVKMYDTVINGKDWTFVPSKKFKTRFPEKQYILTQIQIAERRLARYSEIENKMLLSGDNTSVHRKVYRDAIAKTNREIDNLKRLL